MLAAARTSGVPRPLLVLLERDPWLQVIGSESPAFALYEDGTVIMREGERFVSGRLTPDARQRLLDAVDVDGLRPHHGHFVASEWTDDRTAQLLAYGGSAPVFISVYGSLQDPEVRSRLPRPVVRAFDAASGFAPAGGKKWVPETIEVMLSPYDHAPEASVQWPHDWPDLRDPKTVRRGESFSIFVPAARMDEVRALLARRKPKGAIEIDGRKWAASIRFPFPHEELWTGRSRN